MRFIRLQTCAVALAAVLSAPAFSQPNTGSSNSAGATSTAPATTVSRETERGFDWGWLGLLGLAGLMGLRRHPDVHRTDTTRTAGR